MLHNQEYRGEHNLRNYAGQITGLIILLVFILVLGTGCRPSPLLVKIVYLAHAEPINVQNETNPDEEPDEENEVAVTPKQDEQDAADHQAANSEEQGLDQADAQQDTIQEGAGDIAYGAGEEASGGALVEVISDHGEHIDVPESVANITTVCEATQSPQWKSSRIGDRSKYAGDWKDGMFEGKGTYSWSDGDEYTGQWKDDLIEGKGTYIWADGGMYEGEWRYDMFSGQGIYTWASGSKYAGEWKEGVKEGQGTYTWANKDEYVGEWKAGVKDGQGTYTWADGSIYTGAWKYGVREGQGTYKGADGTIYEGLWSNDKFLFN
ncbi:MAG TPA: hypothetical protein DD738_03745 [Ruminiclostridium sp.]|nr:hypothetical protein [Ruminiclostridium sp.]